MRLNKYPKRKSMKREINEIINRYQIHEIEAALVKFYLQSHNIKVEKNKLILNYLKKNNHESLVKKFSNIIKPNNLKSVERIFELLIEPEDRKINGAFYTPEYIVRYIVDNTIEGDIKVCDPSCGSGAFLIEAIEKIHKDTKKSIISIIENNIYGSDILDYAIRRTKLLLSLLALSYGEDKEEIKFNLMCQDSLIVDWTKEFPKIFKNGDWKDIFGMSENGFDAIIGNPPYVRIQDFGKATKKTIMDRWGKIAKGNFNLHFPFFVLGVKLLKQKGKLGYITPNNYFTSLAAEPLREYLQNNRLLSQILDFDCLQVFEDVTTYTCITFIEKSKKETFEYEIIEEKDKLGNFDKIEFSKISFDNLNVKSGDFLMKRIKRILKKLNQLASY
jgi:Type I restriction-modification system methyltransferase subunit